METPQPRRRRKRIRVRAPIDKQSRDEHQREQSRERRRFVAAVVCGVLLFMAVVYFILELTTPANKPRPPTVAQPIGRLR